MVLRTAAKGKLCMVRIAGVCNHNPETTVLAHYRLPETCGTGMKPPAYLDAWCCSSCHDVVDGRVEVGLSQEERDLALAEGVMRTLVQLEKQGLIEMKYVSFLNETY